MAAKRCLVNTGQESPSTAKALPGFYLGDRQTQASDAAHAAVIASRGETVVRPDPGAQFMIIGRAGFDARQFLKMDAYSAGTAFVRGKFDVEGDILTAIRHFSRQHHSAIRSRIYSGLAHLEHLRTSSLHGLKRPAAKNIQFHYDRSNEFYSQFLDSRMVYSAAHFVSPEDSLEDAQVRKLDLICRDLELAAGDRFLDIGCGWGALVTYAAEHFGVEAFGCTLAEEQLQFAQRVIEERSLSNRVSVNLCDYRDLHGAFGKIASVGMFEHVGRARLYGYLTKAFELLRPGGLFLNRGVVRPQGTCDGPETLFIQKRVFPGGELVHLDDVVREGERAGFEVIGIRNFREDYGLTCKAWVQNLKNAAARCRALVDDATYRTWLLYLAASAVAFADGQIGAAQVLFVKPSHPTRAAS